MRAARASGKHRSYWLSKLFLIPHRDKLCSLHRPRSAFRIEISSGASASSHQHRLLRKRPVFRGLNSKLAIVSSSIKVSRPSPATQAVPRPQTASPTPDVSCVLAKRTKDHLSTALEHARSFNETFQTMCGNTVVNISDCKTHLLLRIKSIKAQVKWCQDREV